MKMKLLQFFISITILSVIRMEQKFDTNGFQTDSKQTVEGGTLSTTNMIVKSTTKTTDEDIKRLAKELGLTYVTKISLMGETFYELIKPEAWTIDETIEALEGRIEIEYARPEYLDFEEGSTVDDPELKLAWYLNNKLEDLPLWTMNIQEAWERGYTGKGVVVAVVDTEIQTNHSDLKANVDFDNSYDYIHNDPDPRPPHSGIWHGTAVAGLVGAIRGNGECTTGVAYNVSLQCVAFLPGDSGGRITEMSKASSLSHNYEQVDIYSNSWAYDTEKYITKDKPLVRLVLQNSRINGRKGKGNIYVFAAGNYGSYGNSALIETHNEPNVISVQSVGYKEFPFYSNVGCDIMTSAYGGDWLKIPLIKPPSACDESGEWGTSYATAVLSGILAIGLQAKYA